jgi:hypothetical protein
MRNWTIAVLEYVVRAACDTRFLRFLHKFPEANAVFHPRGASSILRQLQNFFGL